MPSFDPDKSTRSYLADIVRARSPLPKSPLRTQWPYAGCPITILPLLRHAAVEDGGQCMLEGQPYRITKGYVIPYYEQKSDIFGSEKIQGRNEERIHALANHFFNFCQPELKILRSKEQLQAMREAFDGLSESTLAECSIKAGYFRMLVGASMMRLELLGEIIHEQRVPTDKQSYVHFDNTVAPDSPEMKAQIDVLKAECETIYTFLQRGNLVPIWRTILYHDNTIDYDGLLIDIMREIGKPIRINKEGIEAFVRDGMVRKIGWSLQSIDQIHDTLLAMMEQPIFEKSIANFLEHDGPRYGMHTAQDVRNAFEELTELSRARACIPSRDSAYGDVFARRAVLSEMFNAPTGVLQSMRREGNQGLAEIREIRALLTHGIKLMTRTANSRTPSNQEAPEVFIPNLDDSASVMETYLAQTFLKPDEIKHAREVYAQADDMHLNEQEREAFFRKSFSSVGLLQAEQRRLERKYFQANAISPE